MQTSLPLRLAAVLAVLAFAKLTAQTAPTPTTTPSSSAEVVELSPFEVKGTGEDKWSASNTLLGNRTSQELVKVPVTVDVLTNEFLSDIGVFSLDDAGAFIAGVTSVPLSEARNDDGRLTFRGLSSSSNTVRNFFQWSVPTDTYNVERFDFGKGSNSLMFGDSAPGGQVTTTTKRARFNNATTVLANYTDQGSYRFQIDINRKITRQFAMRINLVNRNDHTYVEGSYQRFRAADLAFTYRPFKNTVITLDAEAGRYERRRSDNTAAINNVAAPGRSFSTNNRWYYTSDGEIIQRTSTTPDAIDRSGSTGSSTLSLLEGQTVGVRLPDGSQKLFSGFDRSFNILGFGDYLDRPYNVVTAMLEQSIGKLSIQASYNQQFQHQDRNDNSFGGSGSPPVINVDGAGRPFIDQGGNLTAYKIFGNTFKAGRVSAAYPFEFGRWMKQDLVLTATRSSNFAVNRRFGLVNTAAPGLAANNAIQFRAYLENPTALANGGWNKFLLSNLPHTATFEPTIVESYLQTGPFNDIRYTRNLTASLSGEYFGGRLSSLFGVSNNRLSRKVPIVDAYVTDARGFITFAKTPEEAPDYYRYDERYSITATSWLSGLTYELIKRENFTANIYGIYSQSFNFQSSLTFSGTDLGSTLGKTREIGLKGYVLKNLIFYTVAAYQIERQNVGFAWTPDILSSVQLEDLFNPNNLLPSDPKYFTVQTGLGNERRTVNSQEKSTGVDVTLIGQRLHGLQARLTFSKTKVEATRDFSDFKRLLDAAIARTTAANAPGGDVSQAENASYIANGQNIYASNTNLSVVTGRRSAPYTGSFVLDYQFTRPVGLRIGMTGVWTPNYNIAILNGLVFRDGATLPIGIYAQYDRKIFGQHTNFRLGAANVADVMRGSGEYYKNSANSLNPATGRPNYIYRYRDPTIYSLSATVKF
jgi:outer membrane receptor protein involved in Fe transport